MFAWRGVSPEPSMPRGQHWPRPSRRRAPPPCSALLLTDWDACPVVEAGHQDVGLDRSCLTIHGQQGAPVSPPKSAQRPCRRRWSGPPSPIEQLLCRNLPPPSSTFHRLPPPLPVASHFADILTWRPPNWLPPGPSQPTGVFYLAQTVFFLELEPALRIGEFLIKIQVPRFF